ncbi:M24 family metallopeptidase [Anoxynatronum buryatiense]|uniref:Xaa-Pro aminopeptidase/Xaa-Pro dipeptidase n=1 Tax=Anoxynatronum buryatiense TaxID=489973 RepID=A0AA45WUP4_9CLOT|nr:Xaa-Pro peptidase family protein [Anoxynatronum buryatiense]SMP48528.1 Xaa-Pro aminopeptidase/Xaa-Pro dipeptidase [Anoxynatronum buryatiense]
MNARLTAIRNWIAAEKLDAVLLSKPANRKYAAGFTGSAGTVVVTPDHQYLITDFRYKSQVSEQSPDFTYLQIDKHESAIKHLRELGFKRVGIEEEFISYSLACEYEKGVPGIELVPMNNQMTIFRSVKEPGEAEIIRRAAAIADKGWEMILNKIQPGISENALALELEFYMRQNGADGVSFQFIVASGLRSALPHGIASDKLIEVGDFLTFDYGNLVDGYCSDMTRTVVVGKATDRQKEIYQTVLNAQKAALKAVRPGITGIELDEIARQIITEAGFGDYFGHGLGHGVGLEIHELPHVNHLGKVPLEPGMVITIEPGIYIPDEGGVRIEDLVLVTADGYEVLSHSNKELVEVPV